MFFWIFFLKLSRFILVLCVWVWSWMFRVVLFVNFLSNFKFAIEWALIISGVNSTPTFFARKKSTSCLWFLFKFTSHNFINLQRSWCDFISLISMGVPVFVSISSSFKHIFFFFDFQKRYWATSLNIGISNLDL